MSLTNKGLSLQRLHESARTRLRGAGLDPDRRGRGMRLDFVTLREDLRNLLDPKWCDKNNKVALKCEDFSIQELYHFCESVDVTQFPVITATLVEKKVIDAFNNMPTVGDKLVTKFPSKLQISKVPGADLSLNMRDIEPGMPYHHDADIAEHYVQVEGKKRGDILDITEEAILFDQTGLVLREAEKFGKKAALDRERKILYTIQDATVGGVNYYAYYPSGSRVALYSGAVALTHVYSNLMDHALQHWTDLDHAKTMFTAMRDNTGDPILVEPKILLLPKAKETVGKRLIANTMVPGARIGVTGVTDNPNEANPFANAYEVVASVYLDIVSTTAWYLGDFKEQFVEKEVYPLQVLTRKDDKNEPAWERDIIAQYKVRYYSQPAAVDYRYVVKSRGSYGTCPNESYCSSWDEAAVA